jgi:hypothetical protein
MAKAWYLQPGLVKRTDAPASSHRSSPLCGLSSLFAAIARHLRDCPAVALVVLAVSALISCSDIKAFSAGQGTKLMTPEKARAIWAIYVWCRRTDELVDGPNASRMNPRVRPRARSSATGLPGWHGARSSKGGQSITLSYQHNQPSRMHSIQHSSTLLRGAFNSVGGFPNWVRHFF